MLFGRNVFEINNQQDRRTSHLQLTLPASSTRLIWLVRMIVAFLGLNQVYFLCGDFSVSDKITENRGNDPFPSTFQLSNHRNKSGDMQDMQLWRGRGGGHRRTHRDTSRH